MDSYYGTLTAHKIKLDNMDKEIFEKMLSEGSKESHYDKIEREIMENDFNDEDFNWIETFQ